MCIFPRHSIILKLISWKLVFNKFWCKKKVLNLKGATLNNLTLQNQYGKRTISLLLIKSLPHFKIASIFKSSSSVKE